MRRQTYFVVFVICQFVLLLQPVYADEQARSVSETETAEPGDRRRLYEIPVGKNPLTGSPLLFFPPGSLYPPNTADPVRVGFGIQPLSVLHSEIPDTGDERINLRAGGELGIIRSESENNPALGWQLNLIGGFNDQNDIKNSLDNIGWDGHYGFLLEMVPVQGLAFKVGSLHVSSHVGDEFMERTGRMRIGYTREELAGGVSWSVTGHWRVYSEAGWAFTLGNHDLQQPWRGQLGMEYESEPALLNGLMAWYAAVDSQTWEERDWRVDIAVQSGLVAHSAGRTWRLGLDWYSGRPPIGEFFQYSERYLSFVLAIDI